MWIRIRIQQLKLMRIHADPDPKPWPPVSKFILSCQQFDNRSHCLPRVSLTPAAILSPVSLTPVAEAAILSLVLFTQEANLALVSLIPVVHLDLRISLQIFEKILNGFKGTVS
jgi:hypothetical protein